MRKSIILCAIASLSLASCGQDFDEKYEDNLQELTAESDEIQASVDQRFKESEEADKILNRGDVSGNDGDFGHNDDQSSNNIANEGDQ